VLVQIWQLQRTAAASVARTAGRCHKPKAVQEPSTQAILSPRAALRHAQRSVACARRARPARGAATRSCQTRVRLSCGIYASLDIHLSDAGQRMHVVYANGFERRRWLQVAMCQRLQCTKHTLMNWLPCRIRNSAVRDLRLALTTPSYQPPSGLPAQTAQRNAGGAGLPPTSPASFSRTNNAPQSTDADMRPRHPEPYVERAGPARGSDAGSAAEAALAAHRTPSERPLASEAHASGLHSASYRTGSGRGRSRGGTPGWAATLIGPGSLRSHLEALAGEQQRCGSGHLEESIAYLHPLRTVVMCVLETVCKWLQLVLQSEVRDICCTAVLTRAACMQVAALQPARSDRPQRLAVRCARCCAPKPAAACWAGTHRHACRLPV
jgi:hypothetical protein